jgi:tRNA A37 threonylcarbamoyladenosine dehydratase
VVVVGLGGVGSWSVEALARSGVGQITLIDFDQIAESNINRQVHAMTETLGMAKVEALKNRIHSIHPGCQVHIVEDFVTPDNLQSIIPNEFDVLIDACDQFTAKLAMTSWALSQGKSLITVGAAGGKSRAELVKVNDLSAVTHDPILARLRREIRKAHHLAQHHFIGVNCVYSQEPIRGDQSCAIGEVQLDRDLNCHGYGSFVGVTATFGLVAAGRAIEGILT